MNNHNSMNRPVNLNRPFFNTQDKPPKNTIHVKDFHLDRIPPGSNILVIGRRGVGKTYLVTELLRHKKEAIPVVFASKYVAQSYKEHLPESNVLDHFDNHKLTQLLEDQINSGGAKEIVLAFDDITNGNTCLMNNISVRDVVKYGSSLNITSVFSVQHAAVFDETFRRNVDYLFIFSDNLKTNQSCVFDRYADMFESEHDFQAIYKECTSNEPHRCLVLDMKTPWTITDGNSVPDGVFWYKANIDHYDNIVEQVQWKPEPLIEPLQPITDNANANANVASRSGFIKRFFSRSRM